MKSRWNGMYLIGILALALTLVPGSSQAGTSEVVRSFQDVATLASDSSLDVRETIVYDFGDQDRHGIYRTIPLIYQSDSGQEYRPSVTVEGVNQDNATATVQQTRSDADLTLKIGDAQSTISGVHTYSLHYRLSPIVQTGSGHDILKFNVTGNGWQVPIMESSILLSLPLGTSSSAQNCFTGDAGSREAHCTVSQSGSTITAVASGELAPGQGLSLFADLPTGTVSTYLQPYVPPKPSPLALIPAVLAEILALATAVRLLVVRLKERALRRGRTIVAEYEAPDGLRPAELGLLNDDRSAMPEITATLIDLAVRGHLRIEQTAKKNLLRPAQYTFHRLTSPDVMEPYEDRLLSAIFEGSDTRELANVSGTKMQTTIASIHNEVGDRLKTRGWYLKRPSAWRFGLPISLLVLAFAGGGISLGGGASATSINELLATFAFGAASVVLSVIVLVLVRRPTGMTPEGAEEWAKVRGFREYLNVAEKARLDFSDAPDKTPERFNRLLPYAVALGVEKAWANQFEGIDVASGSGWYSGYDPTAFSAAYLASSLAGEFNSTVASSFTPVSSSGSSSGGFSGGGFSGGGGGSW